MKNVNERRYPNIDKAVAFEIAFDPFVYFYDNVPFEKFIEEPCDKCLFPLQTGDYLSSRAYCKKDYGILATYEYGVGDKLFNELINNFDISEDDFRPIRTLKGEVVFHQIIGGHILPPIHEINGWIPITCEKCGRTWWNDSGLELYNENDEEYHFITEEAYLDLHDLNRTSELMGKFYYPKRIVNRRVYDFLSERYPRMSFRPFFLSKNI